MGNIGIVQLLIVAVIIILLFGTKKLRGLGSDLGGAIKGFKKAMNDEPKDKNASQNTESLDNKTTSSAEKTESSNKEQV